MTSLSEAFSSSIMAFLKLVIDNCWKSFGPFFSATGTIPFLIVEMFNNVDREAMFTVFKLSPRWLLFFVTSLGVPQSMTRLNLSCISGAVPWFAEGAIAFFLGYAGARSRFLSSAIFYSLSVN